MRSWKTDDTPRRGRVTTALLTVVSAGLLIGAPAQAAQTTTLPTPDNARTFATGAGGWTTATTYGGACVQGVTCPTGTGTFVASGGSGGSGDGFLRDTFATTALSALSSTTVTRTSPAFAIPAGADLGRLNVAVRTDLTQLLAINGSPPRLDMVLRDDTVPANSQTLAQGVRLPDSATFTTLGADVATGALDPAHSYSVVLRTVAPAPLLSAVSSSTVDFDDVALQLVALEPPSGLTAMASSSGPLAVGGVVDPHGLSTSVRVNYGVQGSALSTSTTPVVLSGTGPQAYSTFLTGLQPGTTYDFQVVAQNADGAATTTVSSFTAATPPADSPPTVTGAGNDRQRLVTYDVGSGTTGARVEILDSANTVVSTVTDPQTDGQVSILLPDADGTYTVRVVRDGAGGTGTTSTGVPVVLDRVAPTLAGADLTVTPEVSSDINRNVSFTLPADAVSAELQVLDANGDPVGDPVAAVGGMGTVALDQGDGTYTVRLTVRDAAGNAATTESDPLTVDSSAPSAGAAPIVTGAGNSRMRQVTFDLDASTVTSTIEVVGPDLQVLGTFTVPAGENTAQITLPDDDGTYGVRVRQADGAANESVTPSTAVTLDRVAPNPGSAPAVAGAGNGRQRTVTFDRDPSTSVAQIEVLDGAGNRVGTLQTVTGGGDSITLPDADGVYSIRILQTDANGNTATSPERDVVLDRTAPDPGGAPVLTGTPDALAVGFVRDPETTTATVQILDATGTVIREIVVTGNSTTATLPATPGPYTVRVVQADAAGNTATSPGATTTRTTMSADPEVPGVTNGTGSGTPANPPGTGNDGTGTNGTGTSGTGTSGTDGAGSTGAAKLTDPGNLASILSCLGGSIVLTDAHQVGANAHISGLTLYAPGTVVTIRDTAGKKVATARVDRRGRFSASARLPRSHVGLRYRAVVASSKSPRLRLQSRNRATSAKVKGKRLTVKGRVAKDVVARLKAGRAFQLKVYGGRGSRACSGRRTVLRTIGRPKVNRSTGRYQITVQAPAGSGKLLIRTRLVRPARAFSRFLVK